MNEENIVDWADGSPTRDERLAACELRLAEALIAYRVARDAYDFEPWAAAEKELRSRLDMLLTWRLPSTKSGRSPDGLHVNEISFEGTNIIHVRGRVFCLPSGTEPIAAVFKVDPDEQRLTSYSLRYGNKSEPPAVKAERRIHKAPTDADRWDFEFDWP